MRRILHHGVLLILVLAHATAAFSEATFHKDVEPILQKNCQICHREGEIAPMSLMTYEETRPWVKSIRKRVVDGTMPPWHADPNYGPFKNDRRLSERDIDTLVNWIDGGAREGNIKDAPARVDFPKGWRIGTPDVVLSMEQEYTVQPAGPDEYIYFLIKTNFTEDRWVRAAEIMPGNRKVVHHVLAFVQTAGTGTLNRGTDIERFNRTIGYKLFTTEGGDAVRVVPEAPVSDDACIMPNGGSALSGDITAGRRPTLLSYVPGSSSVQFPDGIGMKIPAGAEVLLQIHYTRTGKPEKDRTSLGLIFSKEPPQKVMQTRWVQNYYFAIPQNADNHEVKGCFTFANDVVVRSFAPHMHLRGKDMEYTAVYPDGRTESLMKVSNYDFSWQTSYILERPLAIPKGTKIIVTAHYDNSAKNRFNPNPNAVVRWGDPTSDEMMIGAIGYTVEPVSRN